MESENAVLLEWFFRTFREKNEEACSKTTNLMTDKDHTQRKVLRQVFPKAKLKLCLFHTLQSFKREVTAKMTNSATERQECLDILSKLAYSKSRAEYDVHYSVLCDQAPEPVLQYYNTNWHNIADEWVVGLVQVLNFLNITNNRIEGLNARIKDKVPLNSSLYNFFTDFFKFLTSNHIERNANTATNFTKTPSSAPSNEDEKKFAAVLTEKAMTHITPEIESSNYITFYSKNPSNLECCTKQYRSVIRSTVDECSCNHYTSLNLPCKHIFATRKVYNRPLFSTSSYDVRWTKKHALKGMIPLNNNNQGEFPIRTIENVDDSTLKVIESSMKARGSNLVYMGTHSTDSNFQQKVDCLKSLIASWNQGLQVLVRTRSDKQPITKAVKNLGTSQRRKILMDLMDVILSPQNRTRERLAQLKEIEDIWKSNKVVKLEGTASKQIHFEKEPTTLSVNDVVLPKAIIIQGKPSRLEETYVGKRKASTKAVSNGKRRRIEVAKGNKNIKK